MHQFLNFIMYADDTVIFFPSAQLMEVELKLNLELTSLSEWLCGNKPLLNLKKTKLVVLVHNRDVVRASKGSIWLWEDNL